MEAVPKGKRFVMTGSMDSIRELFTPLFDLAIFLTAPTGIRLKRLQARKLRKFGMRILPGGDMYEQNQQFLSQAASYDTGEPPQMCLKIHEQWITEFNCPVLRLGGTKSMAKNAAMIESQYLL